MSDWAVGAVRAVRRWKGKIFFTALTASAALTAACQGDARGAGKSEFDAARTWSYVEQQMAFGPRIPNTEAHRRMGDWLDSLLRERADTVLVQQFTHRTSKGVTLKMRNFLGRFRPELTDRVLFLAHWDTRPKADKSRNLGQQQLPVPGANDGASGVAVLLGLADVLKARPSSYYGVDLLFVDGEDWGDFSDSTETLIGSRYYAARLTERDRPLFAVLFDMVGDKDLQFLQEGNSMANAPEVVQRVWSTAERIGYGRYFLQRVGEAFTDDHLPLQMVGVRAIDVIDFTYPYHHTTEDTIDKISAESLRIVGDVAIALLRN